MKKGRIQCKDIPDRPILEMLSKNPEKWHNWYFDDEFDVRRAIPQGLDEKLILAKMGMMIRRKVVAGCSCGCRGDFVITEKGQAWLEAEKEKDIQREPLLGNNGHPNES